jgi:hypothetical protein
MNKIDKHLAKLTTRKREEAQINKIRDKRGILQYTNEIQRIIGEYLENLYYNILENLKKGVNLKTYMTYQN